MAWWLKLSMKAAIAGINPVWVVAALHADACLVLTPQEPAKAVT